MAPFYLCSDPAMIMPPEIAGCVYAFKKPRFFAMVERLGQAGPVSELSYVGANIIFSYGLNGERPVDYEKLYYRGVCATGEAGASASLNRRSRRGASGAVVSNIGFLFVAGGHARATF